MNMEVIKLNVKKFLDEKRYEHVKRVTKCAVEMAKIYRVPVEKVEASAWLHDVAKFFDVTAGLFTFLNFPLLPDTFAFPMQPILITSKTAITIFLLFFIYYFLLFSFNNYYNQQS